MKQESRSRGVARWRSLERKILWPSFCVGAAGVLACSGAQSSDDGSGGTTSPNGGARSGGAAGADSRGGASGGTVASGGNGSNAHGGVAASGATSNGGAQAGGTSSNGGQGRGGDVAVSGGAASGGAASGGAGGAAGGARPASGGASASGGMKSAGGSSAAGGSAGAANSGGAAGAAGGAGGSTAGVRPCDIYASASTPCVAAHSTVRALYGAYRGSLYQVRRASDKTTKDVPAGADGYVDISVQDTFCSATTCTISILYDQSENHNNLVKSPKAHWLDNGGNEANAANGKATVAGHVVHGIYVTGYNGDVAYRNNATKGIATGDQAEAMYMVVDGKRYSDQCCFDYGNAETSGEDDGNGTMEAVYWGTDITWGGKGDGSGPWIAADLENGMFKGDKGGWQSQSISTPGAKSIVAPFATAMLKGPSGNHFTLKGGNAQSGTLSTMWDSVRPSPGYSPKKLQGAIILGTGGDGSNGGTGTFFEGAMTKGNPSDSVDAEIQANIVAAHYGG